MKQVDSKRVVSIKGAFNYFQPFIIIVALSSLIDCGSDEELGISDISGIINTWAGTGSAGFDGDNQPLFEIKILLAGWRYCCP